MVDSTFSANSDSAFTRISQKSVYTTPADAGKGWLTRGEDKHRWNNDVNNQWAYADDQGSASLTQVIESNALTQGLQAISFDATNLGLSNTLRLQVYGIDGQFQMSNWDNTTPSSDGGEPINVVTLLDTGNLATENFDWKTFSWDEIDFGWGYEYIALRFITKGVSDPDTEFQAIDNVFIRSSENSSVPVEGSTTQVNTITGTDGQDILDGTSEDDLIEGNDGNDTLTGNAGNDDLRGGIGDDILRGGAGDDNLRGGSGNDIFNFSANQGRDRIWDFELGDTIRLKNIDPQSLELIELNGNTFLDLGNNQGIELLGVLPDVLKINVLANVIELIL